MQFVIFVVYVAALVVENHTSCPVLMVENYTSCPILVVNYKPFYSEGISFSMGLHANYFLAE